MDLDGDDGGAFWAESWWQQNEALEMLKKLPRTYLVPRKIEIKKLTFRWQDLSLRVSLATTTRTRGLRYHVCRAGRAGSAFKRCLEALHAR
jgi:hypothetical protein